MAARPHIERTWTMTEVTEALKVHRSTIYRYTHQHPEVFGVIRKRRVKRNPGKHRVFTQYEVEYLTRLICVKQNLFHY